MEGSHLPGQAPPGGNEHAGHLREVTGRKRDTSSLPMPISASDPGPFPRKSLTILSSLTLM